MVSWNRSCTSGMSESGYSILRCALLFCILNPFIYPARRLISWLWVPTSTSDWPDAANNGFLCTNPKNLLRSSELQMSERRYRYLLFIINGVFHNSGWVVFRVCISWSAFLGVSMVLLRLGVTEAVTSCSLWQKDITYRTISFLSAQTVVGVLLG